MNLDERKLLILSTIVEEYIRTGLPVGSKHVATIASLCLSSATIRNDMVVLEKLGLLEQPHTSAGRIPTYLAYRLYIERLMQPQLLSQEEKRQIDKLLQQASTTAEYLLDHATNILSELTQLMVVNSTCTIELSMIARVEVIPTGRKLYALLLITSSGEIKNKTCRLELELTDEQIQFFSDVVNHHVKGVAVDQLSPVMLQHLAVALGGYFVCLSPLLDGLFEIASQMSNQLLHVEGKERLLFESQLDPVKLQYIFNSNDQLTQLLQDSFSGIQVIFGPENDMLAITNLSMIVSPYRVNQMQGGAWGVIGPLRLDYAKVIPYMQYFSDCVTKLLSQLLDETK